MMIQNEYRQENKDSSLIADFGLVNNFKSTETNKKKYHICLLILKKN